MDIIFYKHASIEALHPGGDNIEVFRVSFPVDWRGTDGEMVEIADAKFVEKFGYSPKEYGAYHRVPNQSTSK